MLLCGMNRHERRLWVALWGVLAALSAAAATSLLSSGVEAREIALDLWRLQGHPARLITDFSVAAYPGTAVLNAVLVAVAGMVLVRVSAVRLSGPTVAAIFTLLGFGLFGKTVMNVLPIFAGVAVAARIAEKRFRDYILIALFGSALGPLVSLVAVELDLPPILGALAAAGTGVLVGVILPAVAMVMLRLHQGYSLYNMGLTTGFLALFAAAVVFGTGEVIPTQVMWSTAPPPLLRFLIPGISLLLMVTAMSLASPRTLYRELRQVFTLPGRLPSDFMDMVSIPASLANMALMGLLAWGYVVMVGAPLNGPVVGGALTVIGFSAFGKHPRNTWSVALGIAGAAVIFGHSLSAPGVILAALFATTLAPLAGEFGWPVGVLAGALHLLLVLRTGPWHAGIGLYNNGLAGGLTATLLVSAEEWYRATRRERGGSRVGSFMERTND